MGANGVSGTYAGGGGGGGATASVSGSLAFGGGGGGGGNTSTGAGGTGGAGASASASGATAIGSGGSGKTSSSAASGGAGGKGATASGIASTAVGGGATGVADGQAGGNGATAIGNYSIAIGGSNAAHVAANATQTGATAVGNGAQATAANAVALGYNSIANIANTVSVGAVGSERRIVNVAAGTANTDAVNLGQLNTAIAGTYSGWNLSIDGGASSEAIGSGETVSLLSADANVLISRVGSNVSFGIAPAPTFAGMLTANGGFTVGAAQNVNLGGNVIHGVANGAAGTDAVNVGQMNTAIGTAVSGISSYSGWNLSAEGGVAEAIGSGETVGFEVDNANGNLTVTRSGNTITYGFSSAPTFAGLTVGGAGANFTIVNNTIVNMGNNVVGGVANAVAATDAVNKGQLDSGLATANGNAAAAQSTANTALANAATAQTTANNAATAAATAQTTADTALTVANAAQTTANTAVTKADAAQATANTAVTKADAAQATANTALTAANNAVDTAKTYTDTRETAIRSDMSAGDAATLASSKTYTDTTATQTLTASKSYTDSKFVAMQQNFDTFRNDVWTRLEQTDRRIDRNGAMQSAMSQMTASAAGVRTTNRMAVGVGVQNGQAALSVGYQRAVGDKAAFTIGGAFSGNDSSAGVGYGWGW